LKFKLDLFVRGILKRTLPVLAYVGEKDGVFKDSLVPLELILGC
jgi:hypothetical protein